LVSEIQAATTNAGARTQGGLTPDFLALSVWRLNQRIVRCVTSAVLLRRWLAPFPPFQAMFDVP
jgi:hypothetical protein